MRQIIFLLFVSCSFLIGATITGNQGQVAVTGGSVSVTANGSSVNLSSGQTTTFGKNQGPSAPRAITDKDRQNFKNEMDVGSDKDLMNIKYPKTLSKRFIKELQKNLIKKGIAKDRFSYANKQLRLNQVDVELIKDIYPAYYKIVTKYYKKKKGTGKVPTVTIKLAYMKKTHKALFIKYGG